MLLVSCFTLFDCYYGEPIRPFKCPGVWVDCSKQNCEDLKLICDDESDCISGNDGIYCNQGVSTTTEEFETCPPNYCKNDGKCFVEKGKLHCECPAGLRGPTCNTIAMWIPLTIYGFMLIVFVIGVVNHFYQKCKDIYPPDLTDPKIL